MPASAQSSSTPPAKQKLANVFGELFPDWILSGNLGLVRRRTVRIGSFNALEDDLKTVKRGQKVDIVIDPNACLKKTVTVPKNAKRQISAVVDVHLRQNLPGQGRGLTWRMSKPQKVDDRLQVDAYVLKDVSLNRLNDGISKAGGLLRSIKLIDVPGASPFVDNRANLNSGARVWTWLAGLAYIGVLAAIGWNLQISANEAELRTAEFRTQRDALSSEAISLAEAARAAEASRGSGESDLRTLLEGTGRTQLLSRLTSLIEEDIWLTEFALRGNELQLSGSATGDVVSLVSKLQSSPWVERATLSGPVTKDPFEGTSRFDLLVGVKPLNTEGDE